MKPDIALLAVLVVQTVSARDIPANVQSFYKRAKSGRCEGTDKLKGGFFDQDGDGAKGRTLHPYQSVAPFCHGR